MGAVTAATTKVPDNWNSWLGNNASNRYQVTGTVYDLPATGIDPLLLQNPSTLRNRVSFSSVTPGQKGSEPVYSTYYNYDIEGNVSSLLQDYGATSPMGTNDQQYKRIDYGYDLVSGKVNSVSYQPGKPDAFMHFYRYDAENRLTDVYTTADSVTVEHEAHYEYYKHGPVARTLIGQNQVQGLDYAYTLQGWLKAVNGSTLDSVKDMGRDGDPTVQSRKYIPKDAYGFSLHYFAGDYYPINGTAFLMDLKTKLGSGYRGLYNGNISSMAVNIGILNNPKLYNYHYDQLNRLTGMDVLNGTNTGINLWTNNLTATADYRERTSYDPNGNILTYTRNGYGSTQSMDNLTYNYNSGTNQLNHIGDDPANSGNYPNDLDNQNAENYKYDAAGNLIRDSLAGITTDMTWSVYGKLLTIPSKSVSYSYDAAGNRIGKTVGSTNTWYVRDAQGNILTTYSGEHMTMQERDLYGSSRLGIISNPAALPDTTVYLDHLGSGSLFTFTRGQKLFELTNHLGNVLATISDKKFGTPVTGIPSQIAYYTADVKSAQDYYPFGQTMPGRTYNSLPRYTFNGKEYDPETGYQDYGMRMYDGGRFISPDPLTKKYPWYTPYQFAGNNPIMFVDIDGQEPWNLLTQYFIADAALTVIKNPNSTKAKVYGAVMGVGSSVQKTVKGAYDVVRHPINTLNGIGNMLGKSSVENAIDYGISISQKYADMGSNGFTDYAIVSEALTDLLFTVEGSRSLLKPTGIGTEISTLNQVRKGIITGDEGVLFSKVRAAVAGDLSAAAELRVAKSLRGEGKNVHFMDADAGNAAGTGTYDFTVNGIKTDVKRISGLGSNAAGDIAKGVKQVGPDGEVIIVRPSDSKFTLQQYQDFINNFKPKQPVTLKVVEESSLPKIGGE